MHGLLRLVAFAAVFSPTLAAFQGFNYGSAFTSGAAKQQSDFQAEFSAARRLLDAPGDGFTSARLYTTIQGGTISEPISAIPAAIETQTTLLLGIWCSHGDDIVANELQALMTAITRHGLNFTNLVAGISVGSEDLYRVSPTGIKNGENGGTGPLTIATYIEQVRDALTGTPLSDTPIGHVDTWTAWVNVSNQAVIDASDWIGLDAYPYFQETQANAIANNKALFDEAYAKTKKAVGDRPIWITETGYPVSGKTVGMATPSVDNAKVYWDQVGCPRFGKENVWWYTFRDALPTPPNPSFGIIGGALTDVPVFNISCTSPHYSSSGIPVTGHNGAASVSSSIGTVAVALVGLYLSFLRIRCV